MAIACVTGYMPGSGAQRAIVRALLDKHGRTFCEELHIAVEKNTPAPLFQLLCASLLYSARISAANASKAMRGLIEVGLTTPAKMAAASWQQRVDAITDRGYKRYDERTSTMLGHTAELLHHAYGGDLRRLRDKAGRQVAREHELLQDFSGIGPVGADIFLREVQVAWDEVYPYADSKVQSAARHLGLPDDPSALARLSGRANFPALAAALVRTELRKDHAEIRSAARAPRRSQPGRAHQSEPRSAPPRRESCVRAQRP
jgi:endonuclease III